MRRYKYDAEKARQQLVVDSANLRDILLELLADPDIWPGAPPDADAVVQEVLNIRIRMRKQQHLDSLRRLKNVFSPAMKERVNQQIAQLEEELAL